MTKKRRHSRHEQDRAAAIAAPEQPAPPQSKRAASPYVYAAVLVALQLLVATIVLWQFLSGRAYFAYSDVGSDSHDQFIPMAIHLAHELQRGWPGTWSFEFGLGAATRLGTNPFLLLNAALGPDAVPGLRIWVYLSKLAMGGLCLYWALLKLGRSPLAALVAAVSFSFCGFITVDGQWDPHAIEFAMYPLILWGLASLHANRAHMWLLPTAIATAIYSSVFPFSIAVFLALCFVAALIVSDDRRRIFGDWLTIVLPLALLGFMLAAPQVLAYSAQLLDSPRVTGAQSGFPSRLLELFSLNNARTIHAQIAGLFHKDLLGTGSAHRGWMNYLEGPTFFVGFVPLLVIPQLWHGTRLDRRVLVATLLGVTAFIAFPAIRGMAFGFALPYFRVNNLWVSLLLIIVAARALDLVLARGISRVSLWVTVGVIGALAIAVEAQSPQIVSTRHLVVAGALVGVCAVVLHASAAARSSPMRLGWALVALSTITAVACSHSPFNLGRRVVTQQTLGFDDVTMSALKSIQGRHSGFYRVEKSFDSVSLCDSLAQGYMGVKSYWFHGAGVVRLYKGLNVTPSGRQRQLNPTNWLPNFGSRYALYSLVGVKFFISKTQLDWPGFREIAQSGGVRTYENDCALPLGVVYTNQISDEAFEPLPPDVKDFVILRAAVLERPLPDMRSTLTSTELRGLANAPISERYFAPIRELQAQGLSIDSFSHSRITGHLDTNTGGVLVLSIPYSPGWSITIDGTTADVFAANFGMLATQIDSGKHRIEVQYVSPGHTVGVLLSSASALVVIAIPVMARRGRINDAHTNSPLSKPDPGTHE